MDVEPQGVDFEAQKALDNHYMRIALMEAIKNRREESKVGACVVDGRGKILGLGHNSVIVRELHDEADREDRGFLQRFLHIDLAVEAALNNAHDFKGCTVYLTSYPTPFCVKEMIRKDIARFVYYDVRRTKYVDEGLYYITDPYLRKAENSGRFEIRVFNTDQYDEEITRKIRELLKIDFWDPAPNDTFRH